MSFRFFQKDVFTRLTYKCKGCDVRRMTHKVCDVKTKQKSKKEMSEGEEGGNGTLEI